MVIVQAKTSLDKLAEIPRLVDELRSIGSSKPVSDDTEKRSTFSTSRPPTRLETLNIVDINIAGSCAQLLQNLVLSLINFCEKKITNLDQSPRLRPFDWDQDCAWIASWSTIWNNDQTDDNQPDVAGTIDYIYTQLRRAHQIVDPPVLICPKPGCGGRLELRDGGSWMGCTNGHVIDHWAEIRRYGRLIEGTAASLAKLTGISRKTINQWHSRGKLSAVRMTGSRPVFTLADIQELAENSTITTTAPTYGSVTVQQVQHTLKQVRA
jgi:hypothetical protein